MAFRHSLQASRFELKYIVDETVAQGVRNFVSAHLELDEYARECPGYAYSVQSLYCDSPALTLCQQTRQGLKNRFKLRVRFYDGNIEHPVFMEIKRRVTDVICKERAAISREGVACLVDGGWPKESHLMGKNGDVAAAGALRNFCSLYESIDARPCIYVCYMREAYVSPNSNQVRVTFDRGLFGSAFDRDTCMMPRDGGPIPDVGGVILELKFTDRFPPWMRELVQAFSLQRCSAPKYNMCVSAMQLQPGLWCDAGMGMAP
jgi:hypothetical protein